jgi:hypothetical protein
MLILSLRFTVQLESPGPNSQLHVPLYSHSLGPLNPSNWFPYIDAAWTHIIENTWLCVCCGCCLAMDLRICHSILTTVPYSMAVQC